MSIINSPKKETLRDALLGGAICGSGVSIYQYMVGASVEAILLAGTTQFATTALNASINLRIYNAIKQYIYKKTQSTLSAKMSGGVVAGAETFLLTFSVHEFSGSTGSFSIGLTLGLMSAFLTPTIYERILETRRKVGGI